MAEVFDEIDWDPKPILRPGMDFRDGVSYFTIPLHRNLVKAGKGKDADPIHYKEQQTFVITSEGKGFWYDTETLDIEGFVPSGQVYQESSSKWSLTSARAYLEGESESVDTDNLFNEIREIYTTYVEFAEEIFHDIMSLYVMYTYIFRLFESTGYIHFNGTAASGKSRNLSILDALAFNSTWASSMSAASLYRKLAGSPGATLIDESEGFEGERGEDLRRILNAGYKDGSKVIRTEKGKDDKFTPIEYDVFGPKALASINPLEQVIATRCMVVTMRPAIRELPEFRNKENWAPLRDRLYVWALRHAQTIAELGDAWRTEKHARLAPRLIGRQWEIASQFVILADFIGGEEFATRIITFLNDYFEKQQEQINATDRLRTTLRCLPRVLATKTAHPTHLYSVKDIHEVVSSYLEEDQTEYFKTRHVSKALDTLGFKKKVRASGGLRVLLEEDALRKEFAQRRVEPFDEDAEWLTGTTTYQNRVPETRNVSQAIPEEGSPWWEPGTEDDR